MAAAAAVTVLPDGGYILRQSRHVRNGIVDWPHRGSIIWPRLRAPLLMFLETIRRMMSGC